MKLVLFPTGPRHFFSYTETDKEVSLILDESHISGFPTGALNVCSVVWRAMQIEPGECGLGTEEVVSQVSRPLADINVSIMQISTYDADFTLMPECDLQKALRCLSDIFSITNNPLEDSGLQASDLKSWENSYPLSPSSVTSLQDALLLDPGARERQSSLNGDNGVGTIEGPSAELDSSGISYLSLNDTEHGSSPLKPLKPRHPFKANYPHRLHITSMEESLMDVLAIRLLEMERFFSFTQTDTTLSIIMDDATLSLFPEHTLNTHAGDWRLIAIGDGPLGFDECGIVSEFSKPLSENGIGLFYLSTFNSDYIMVNEQDFEKAVACLHETAKEVSIEDGLGAFSSSLTTTASSTMLKDCAHGCPIHVHGDGLPDNRDLDGQSIHSTDASESEPGSECDSDTGSDENADSLSEMEPDDDYDGDMDAKHDDDLEIVFAHESTHK
ncbi:GATS protein-like 3 [Mortierella claussenii]|nr:GATS protein-like 3 [Mortierella claussenii]